MYGSSFECSCKTTFGLEVGEEVDSGAHAERHQYVNADAREHVVLVEPSAQGVLVLGAQPDGASAIVVIPWDQAVGVSRRILQLAPNRDDVR